MYSLEEIHFLVLADKHKLGPSSLELDGALLVPQCPSLEQPFPPASHAPFSPTDPNWARSIPCHSLPERLRVLHPSPDLTRLVVTYLWSSPQTLPDDSRHARPGSGAQAQVGRSITEPAPIPAQHGAVRNSQDTLQVEASPA